MPDVTPHELHISRRYGYPFHRAPRTEDGRPVPAGLLARSSDAPFSLPDTPEPGFSGINEESLPLTVAGAAAALPDTAPAYRVPFSPAARHRTDRNQHEDQAIRVLTTLSRRGAVPNRPRCRERRRRGARATANTGQKQRMPRPMAARSSSSAEPRTA